MLFNPIITDFVKTSHLFHVIIIELKRQKQIYSIILPESKKIMSSKITLNRQRHKGAWLNRIQKEIEKVWPPPLSLRHGKFEESGLNNLRAVYPVPPQHNGALQNHSILPPGYCSIRFLDTKCTAGIHRTYRWVNATTSYLKIPWILLSSIFLWNLMYIFMCQKIMEIA